MIKLVAKLLSTKPVFNYLLNRAIKTPYQHIYGAKDKELYMERYWLFNPLNRDTKGLKHPWCPISIRIHKIVKPDSDRHLHDHPWNARTFILKGWYFEERENEKNILRYAGDTAKLNFNEYHRISRVSPEGAYTMFVTGKYRGTWGFLVEGVKLKYWEYLSS